MDKYKFLIYTDSHDNKKSNNIVLNGNSRRAVSLKYTTSFWINKDFWRANCVQFIWGIKRKGDLVKESYNLLLFKKQKQNTEIKLIYTYTLMTYLAIENSDDIIKTFTYSPFKKYFIKVKVSVFMIVFWMRFYWNSSG